MTKRKKSSKRNPKKSKPKGPPWYWGDKRVDWEGIEDAAEFLGLWFRETARMNVMQWKEKFGGVRVYCTLGYTQIHELFYPGHAYIRWNKFFSWIDNTFFSAYGKLGLIRVINKIALPIHEKLYRWRYQKAVDKWPHLKLEILIDADHQELIEGIHGYKHADHWKSI